MGTPARGKRRRLARSRVNICDFMHFARGTPAFAMSRAINVGQLANVRAGSPVRISWPSLFMRSLVIVSTRRPFLRQCYMRWPWAHVYEVEHAVMMLTVQREFRGEDWVF